MRELRRRGARVVFVSDGGASGIARGGRALSVPGVRVGRPRWAGCRCAVTPGRRRVPRSNQPTNHTTYTTPPHNTTP
eukprot:9066622-Prorocentrum_lima.AAC.1